MSKSYYREVVFAIFWDICFLFQNIENGNGKYNDIYDTELLVSAELGD